MISQIVIFISLVLIILALGHWILYRTLLFFLAVTNPSWQLTLKIGLGVLAISFLAALLLVARYQNVLVQKFYHFSAIWLGVFFYLFAAAIVCWLIYWLSGSNPGFPMKIISSVFFSAALLVGAYGVVNARTIQITRLNIELPNLPANWKGKTIAYISDLHLGAIYDKTYAEKVVEQLNQLQPEAVFIGGDYYDGIGSDPITLASPLERLHPPQGIYFVTGNHENFGNVNVFLDALKKSGVRILNDEKVDLGGIQLVGTAYRAFGEDKNFAGLLASLKIDPNRPSILLKHVPADIPSAAAAGISLQLSGHTHVGQMYPFSYITHAVYNGFDYGLKQEGNTQVYTSSGLGTWGPPLRVGTLSEMVLITFK